MERRDEVDAPYTSRVKFPTLSRQTAAGQGWGNLEFGTRVPTTESGAQRIRTGIKP